MSYIVTNMTSGEELEPREDLASAIELCNWMFAKGDDPYWVVIEHKMVYRPNDKPKLPRGEDIAVIMSPEAQAKVDENPELVELVKDANARIRQALDGIATGRFANLDEAMRSIGATPLEFDEEDET